MRCSLENYIRLNPYVCFHVDTNNTNVNYIRIQISNGVTIVKRYIIEIPPASLPYVNYIGENDLRDSLGNIIYGNYCAVIEYYQRDQQNNIFYLFKTENTCFHYLPIGLAYTSNICTGKNIIRVQRINYCNNQQISYSLLNSNYQPVQYTTAANNQEQIFEITGGVLSDNKVIFTITHNCSNLIYTYSFTVDVYAYDRSFYVIKSGIDQVLYYYVYTNNPLIQSISFLYGNNSSFVINPFNGTASGFLALQEEPQQFRIQYSVEEDICICEIQLPVVLINNQRAIIDLCARHIEFYYNINNNTNVFIPSWLHVFIHDSNNTQILDTIVGSTTSINGGYEAIINMSNLTLNNGQSYTIKIFIHDNNINADLIKIYENTFVYYEIDYTVTFQYNNIFLDLQNNIPTPSQWLVSLSHVGSGTVTVSGDSSNYSDPMTVVFAGHNINNGDVVTILFEFSYSNDLTYRCEKNYLAEEIIVEYYLMNIIGKIFICERLTNQKIIFLLSMTVSTQDVNTIVEFYNLFSSSNYLPCNGANITNITLSSLVPGVDYIFSPIPNSGMQFINIIRNNFNAPVLTDVILDIQCSGSQNIQVVFNNVDIPVVNTSRNITFNNCTINYQMNYTLYSNYINNILSAWGQFNPVVLYIQQGSLGATNVGYYFFGFNNYTLYNSYYPNYSIGSNNITIQHTNYLIPIMGSTMSVIYLYAFPNIYNHVIQGSGFSDPFFFYDYNKVNNIINGVIFEDGICWTSHCTNLCYSDMIPYSLNCLIPSVSYYIDIYNDDLVFYITVNRVSYLHGIKLAIYVNNDYTNPSNIIYNQNLDIRNAPLTQTTFEFRIPNGAWMFNRDNVYYNYTNSNQPKFIVFGLYHSGSNDIPPNTFLPLDVVKTGDINIQFMRGFMQIEDHAAYMMVGNGNMVVRYFTFLLNSPILSTTIPSPDFINNYRVTSSVNNININSIFYNGPAYVNNYPPHLNYTNPSIPHNMNFTNINLSLSPPVIENKIFNTPSNPQYNTRWERYYVSFSTAPIIFMENANLVGITHHPFLMISCGISDIRGGMYVLIGFEYDVSIPFFVLHSAIAKNNYRIQINYTLNGVQQSLILQHPSEHGSIDQLLLFRVSRQLVDSDSVDLCPLIYSNNTGTSENPTFDYVFVKFPPLSWHQGHQYVASIPNGIIAIQFVNNYNHNSINPIQNYNITKVIVYYPFAYAGSVNSNIVEVPRKLDTSDFYPVVPGNQIQLSINNRYVNNTFSGNYNITGTINTSIYTNLQRYGNLDNLRTTPVFFLLHNNYHFRLFNYPTGMASLPTGMSSLSHLNNHVNYIFMTLRRNATEFYVLRTGARLAYGLPYGSISSPNNLIDYGTNTTNISGNATQVSNFIKNNIYDAFNNTFNWVPSTTNKYLRSPLRHTYYSLNNADWSGNIEVMTETIRGDLNDIVARMISITTTGNTNRIAIHAFSQFFAFRKTYRID